MSERKEYPISVVAVKTGLSVHLIRMWEKRYEAVSPARTETNRRLYSEQDIRRLALLNRAVGAGHAIGSIVALPEEELHLLTGLGGEPHREQAQADYIEECISAVEKLDSSRLYAVLSTATVELGLTRAVEEVILPLARTVGDLWIAGSLRIHHEHFVSGILRTCLGEALRSITVPETAPRAVAATPVTQVHELGALSAAVIAAAQGWCVFYLGPDLPAEEIAGAVSRGSARLLLLSIVYPAGSSVIEDELTRLSRFLPEGTAVFCGGHSSASYSQLLEKLGFLRVDDYSTLRAQLLRLSE